MTLFQSLFFLLALCLGELLPLGPWVQQHFLTQLTDWSAPPGILAGTIYLGIALATTFHFRHDLLSQGSSILKVLIYRKRPQALDERLPLFLTLTVAPFWLAKRLLPSLVPEAGASDRPWREWIALLLCGILIWFWDGYSKKNRGMFDWTLADAVFFSVGYSAGQVLGLGAIAPILLFCLMRNYQREVALKYALLSALPGFWLIAFSHLGSFSDALREASSGGVSKLTLSVSLLASILASVLIVGTLERGIARGARSFAAYQILLALLSASFWIGKSLHWF